MGERALQAILLISTLALSWLAMMAVHELGHVLHAQVSGGHVVAVELNPLTFSRTDVAPNPHPQWVAWGGALWGTLLPTGLWAIGRLAVPAFAWIAKFFAGFCAIANGVYLAAGMWTGVGDAGDLIRHGAAPWHLWVAGAATAALGLWMWNGLGPHFGFGRPRAKIDRRATAVVVAALVIVAVVELLLFA